MLRAASSARLRARSARWRCKSHAFWCRYTCALAESAWSAISLSESGSLLAGSATSAPLAQASSLIAPTRSMLAPSASIRGCRWKRVVASPALRASSAPDTSTARGRSLCADPSARSWCTSVSRAAASTARHSDNRAWRIICSCGEGGASTHDSTHFCSTGPAVTASLNPEAPSSVSRTVIAERPCCAPERAFRRGGGVGVGAWASSPRDTSRPRAAQMLSHSAWRSGPG
mmetsp:Transcript_30395/g.58439  ORF Transcript_30395/g.58439 Transcript_30395/m.58439 type:complete len:230 (+) Transcript_30395:1135-1824(+)